MRRAAILGLLALLGACRQEPSFEERYAEQQRQLEARARAIDAELAASASDAAAADLPTDPASDR